MKIAFLTDTHLDESAPRRHGVNTRKNLQQVAAAIADEKPDLVVFGGDMGTTASHSYFRQQLTDFPLKIIAGNHDNPQALVRNFDTELFYALDHPEAKLIFLDSSDTLPMLQLEFLQTSLAPGPNLVFIHHPILPVPSVVDHKYPLDNRNAVQDILVRHKYPVFVFCGHNHCIHESSYQNITQFVTPAVSYQILLHQPSVKADGSYTGFRIIEVNNGVTSKVVTLKT